MNKVFLISSLIIGAIIGAGFASGREIVAFFGVNPSPLVALAVGVCVFFFTLCYLLAVKKSKATTLCDYHEKIAGKFAPVLTCIILTNCAVTTSAMLSGLDALLCQIYPLSPLYSVIASVICVVVTIKGRKSMLNCNGVIVPLLVFIIVLVCLSRASDFYCFSVNEKILNSISYISLNAMLCAPSLVGEKDLSVKQSLLISLICAVVVGLLTLVISLAISSGNYSNESMPIVAISAQNPVIFVVAFLGIGFAIFSTLISSHYVLSEWTNMVVNDKTLSAIITVCGCLALSFLGFKKVVDTLYPIIAIVSLLYALVTLIYLVKRPRDSVVKPWIIKRPKSTSKTPIRTKLQ